MPTRPDAERAQSQDEQVVGGEVDLHYAARAGLLPELSRQTYDSLDKALREAILNAVDASATDVCVDFTHVESERCLTVEDDGHGMTTREFCEQFMSLGGSGKFGSSEQFGRIGIGSLALLQYGAASTIETKAAGSPVVTVARIAHPWSLSRDERRVGLGEMRAGTAGERIYDGPVDDHFTRVRIEDVTDDVVRLASDPASFYALIGRLRRVLPLPLGDGVVIDHLARIAPELVDALEGHIAQWSAPVRVRSEWEGDLELTWRGFGDDAGGTEGWTGPLLPIEKTLRIDDEHGRRRVKVAGYLLNQMRPSPTWMGVTARVQNVAVEEQTFFDVTADPGFRKYISGEIWILGDVDRERLINIDRASFNRESADYRGLQRFMARALTDFKASGVQRPQQRKVAVRRVLEDQRALIAGLREVMSQAERLGSNALPVSERHRVIRGAAVDLADQVGAAGAEVNEDEAPANPGYSLKIASDGSLQASVDPDLASPKLEFGRFTYSLRLVAGGEEAPAIVVRNRPRRIVVNLDHPMHAGSDRAAAVRTSLALEVAYLLAETGEAADMHELASRLLVPPAG